MSKFVANKGYIVVSIPKDFTSKVIVHESLIEKKREDYIKEGNSLVVESVGEEITFVTKGDKILVTSSARIQKVEVEEDVLYVIKEYDILGKIE